MHRANAYKFSSSLEGELKELLALLAEGSFGIDGPPRETDFAAVRAFDEQADACPICGAPGDVAAAAKEISSQT